jgi:tetratricopeptide (TPR) repeat protein
MFAALVTAVGGTRPEFEGREAEFRQRAKVAFDQARERYVSDTNNVVAAWEFGRAAFDLAEFARNKSERETIAVQGVAACRRGVKLEPTSAPAYYYLGMNLGQQARVYLLKGLRIVSEMEKVFLIARKLDPRFDYAGPDRALGLLYHHAPGWPISLGNPSKANRHFNEAVRLHPDYPGNRIALAEFLWNTAQTIRFAQQRDAIFQLIPRAKEEFSGPDWELSWIEWTQQLGQMGSQTDSN